MIRNRINRLVVLCATFLLALSASGQEYREGEIIVKLKSASRARIRTAAGSVTSGVNDMDAVLQNIGASSVEALSAESSGTNAGRRVKAYNGSTLVIPDASKMYHLRFDAGKVKVMDAVRQLQEMAEVEYAEPNYIVRMTEAEETTVFDDPFLAEQTYLTDVGVPQLWQAPVLNRKRPVIAILDTGVNVTHPDLADNIRGGWDFVNDTDNIRDNNGHGTHCAGIAAAVGGNGIGIVGANPDAWIMPVTVLQSNGQGDVATIIRGIEYAVENGADVISMSFGLYVPSKAFEQALANAYINTVLVAAAGNDCLPLHGLCFCGKEGKPMFPAAYNFVLGVQSKDAFHVFSNYDGDGPVKTLFNETQQYNYELTAPGMQILSTYPGGQYKKLSGTSMAAPLMAGAISRLLQAKEIDIHEELLGDLIYSAPKNIAGDLDEIEYTNLWTACQIRPADRKPSLEILECRIDDSMGNGNGECNAGETIDLYPVIKNVWGAAKNVRVKLERQEGVEAGAATILNDEISFPSISSYAKEVAAEPLRINVSAKCDDELYIPFTMTVTCDNQTEPLEHEFMLKVYNRVEFYGTLTKDTTLYAGVNYYIPHPVRIPAGITLTIMPGAHLVFGKNAGFVSSGNILCKGTVEDRILFEAEDESDFSDMKFSISGSDEEMVFEYTDFNNLHIRNLDGTYHKCGFNNCQAYGGLWVYGERFRYCNFANCDMRNVTKIWGAGRDNTFAGNSFGTFTQYPMFKAENESGNNFVCNIARENNKPILVNGGPDKDYSEFVMHTEPSYYGSSKEETVRLSILDFSNPIESTGITTLDLSNMLTRPNPGAPGCVWKVLVNGVDAQDERELLDPLGFGEHKVEVYFSKPMNKAYVPAVGMGLTEPYDQLLINQRGEWNEEGDIYTVFFTLVAKSQCDGVNTISVRGARDCENFLCGDEFLRFQVEVQIAEAMATNLVAEAGVNSVRLTWETDEEDFADLMGYNIVRQELWDEFREVTIWEGNIGYSALRDRSDFEQVNEMLLPSATTEYIDYDVEPGKKYLYMVKEMGTDFQQFDISNEAVAVPLHSIPGDVNGDGSVNVVDVVNDINYITGQTPKPFVFESADLNKDKNVNILDVILTVNIIVSTASASEAHINLWAEPSICSGTVFVEDGVLWIDSPVALSGLQIMTSGGGQWINQQGMECLSSAGTFLCYSMAGNCLTAGRHALMIVGDADITGIIAGDVCGKPVALTSPDATGIADVRQQASEGRMYDISGRCINPNGLEKGFYIVNSKKYIKR